MVSNNGWSTAVQSEVYRLGNYLETQHVHRETIAQLGRALTVSVFNDKGSVNLGHGVEVGSTGIRFVELFSERLTFTEYRGDVGECATKWEESLAGSLGVLFRRAEAQVPGGYDLVGVFRAFSRILLLQLVVWLNSQADGKNGGFIPPSRTTVEVVMDAVKHAGPFSVIQRAGLEHFKFPFEASFGNINHVWWETAFKVYHMDQDFLLLLCQKQVTTYDITSYQTLLQRIDWTTLVMRWSAFGVRSNMLLQFISRLVTTHPALVLESLLSTLKGPRAWLVRNKLVGLNFRPSLWIDVCETHAGTDGEKVNLLRSIGQVLKVFEEVPPRPKTPPPHHWSVDSFVTRLPYLFVKNDLDKKDFNRVLDGLGVDKKSLYDKVVETTQANRTEMGKMLRLLNVRDLPSSCPASMLAHHNAHTNSTNPELRFNVFLVHFFGRAALAENREATYKNMSTLGNLNIKKKGLGYPPSFYHLLFNVWGSTEDGMKLFVDGFVNTHPHFHERGCSREEIYKQAVAMGPDWVERFERFSSF